MVLSKFHAGSGTVWLLSEMVVVLSKFHTGSCVAFVRDGGGFKQIPHHIRLW